MPSNHAVLATEFVADAERARWHDEALWFVVDAVSLK